LLPSCVGLADGGGVLVLFLRRHQIALGTFNSHALFSNFSFQSRACMSGFVPASFEGPNFKGALIEFRLDLGAPFGYRF